MKKTFASLLIICFLLTPVLVYANQTPTGISFSEMEQRIDELISEYLGITTPGVAVAVVSNGEIVFSRGYGYADIVRQIPVSPENTVFELGSTSKTFVWVAVMQLVEQGLIDLDADIHLYLPEDFARQLDFEYTFTMRNLMNHTAGFAENLFSLFYNAEVERDGIGLRDALLLTQPQQIRTPGTASAYSNFGTALAAYVVGYVSGMGYAAFEAVNIFNPLGMSNTLNEPQINTVFLEAKARGYIPVPGGGNFQEGWWASIPIYPAGAVNSTVHDMAQFIKALTPSSNEQNLLFENHETLAQMFTPSSVNHGLSPGTYHGFMRHNGILPSFGHGGNTITFSTNFVVVPEERFGFVVLTNAANESSIIPGLSRLLLGDGVHPVVESEGSMPPASSVTGRYMMSRRIEGNFTELLNYIAFPIANVYDVDSNTIVADFGQFGRAVYQQVFPFTFRMISIEQHGFITLISDGFHFSLDGNGRPYQMHIGNGFDFSRLPPGRGMFALTVYGVLAVVNVLFFLITPFVLLIKFLRNRNNSAGLLINAFVLSGTLLVLNNLVCVARFAMQNFRSATEMAPHIWINYVLVLLAALLFCFNARHIVKLDMRLENKVIFALASVSLAVFAFILNNWNFLSIL